MSDSDYELVPGRLTNPGPDQATILIIEDNESQAQFMATLVSSLGYGFELAGDGAEGLTKARQVRPVLILLDLQMPVFDGAGFLKRFQNTPAFAETPVIVTTASQSVGTITKVCALGARDFIAKPIDPATLIAKIQRHVRRRR